MQFVFSTFQKESETVVALSVCSWKHFLSLQRMCFLSDQVYVWGNWGKNWEQLGGRDTRILNVINVASHELYSLGSSIFYFNFHLREFWLFTVDLMLALCFLCGRVWCAHQLTLLGMQLHVGGKGRGLGLSRRLQHVFSLQGAHILVGTPIEKAMVLRKK